MILEEETFTSSTAWRRAASVSSSTSGRHPHPHRRDVSGVLSTVVLVFFGTKIGSWTFRTPDVKPQSYKYKFFFNSLVTTFGAKFNQLTHAFPFKCKLLKLASKWMWLHHWLQVTFKSICIHKFVHTSLLTVLKIGARIRTHIKCLKWLIFARHSNPH